jgi:uncharacterized protein (DUF1015 family)
VFYTQDSDFTRIRLNPPKRVILMAEILPFHGIVYNTKKINNPADVMAPPYDVIPPPDQQRYHDRHACNVIRLILGQPHENDTADDNPHTRATSFFEQWLAEDTLVREERAAFYLKSIQFVHGNQQMIRYGLIASVRLEPFSKGVVLPHERTFSKVKSERLKLIKASRANFCPIFGLYPDKNGLYSRLVASTCDQVPMMEFADEQNHHHRLWRITDPTIHDTVYQAIKNESLYIADGHHRYETALNYRDWLSQTDPRFDDNHPANFVMMYLASMQDPGLIILPAHRLLKALPETQVGEFFKAARRFFDITPYPYTQMNRDRVRSQIVSDLAAQTGRNAMVVGGKGHTNYYLLTLKAGVMDELYGDTLDETIRYLDVTVLTRLVLVELLGFDQARLDNADLIGYTSQACTAMQAVQTGECDMAFVLNPTSIEQVRQVAHKRLIMPRKSTYFYPKVISGIVLNDVDPQRSTAPPSNAF